MFHMTTTKPIFHLAEDHQFFHTHVWAIALALPILQDILFVSHFFHAQSCWSHSPTLYTFFVAGKTQSWALKEVMYIETIAQAFPAANLSIYLSIYIYMQMIFFIQY